MQKSNMMKRRSLLLAVLPVLLAAAPAPDSQDRATPDGSPGAWLTDADYPLDAQRAEQEGVVAFELAIDVRGVPTRCREDQQWCAQSGQCHLRQTHGARPI